MANGTDAYKVFLSEITLENVRTKVTGMVTNKHVFHDWTMFSKLIFFKTVFCSTTPMIDWAVLLHEKSNDGHSQQDLHSLAALQISWLSMIIFMTFSSFP